MEKESDYVLLQSQTIDWLRFPLAVAVVFIHSFGYPLTYTCLLYTSDAADE